MNADHYQLVARRTAFYPAAVSVYQPALGLLGEVGEIANGLKKVLRGDGQINTTDRDYLRKELSDVLWYVAAIASDCGLCLGIIAFDAIARLENSNADIYDIVMCLGREAGAILSMAQEWRHEGPSDCARSNMKDALTFFLGHVASLCVILETDLPALSAASAAKLAARAAVGTLRGSGDNR